jgi:hypothetical protein
MESSTTPWGSNLAQFLDYEHYVLYYLLAVCCLLFVLQAFTVARAIKNKLTLMATVAGLLTTSQLLLAL